MMNTQLDTLPETSFVPFGVEELPAAKLAWKNPSFDLPLAPEAYFLKAIEASDTGHVSRVAHAERYGGRGLGANGGGGRCGLFGGVQIKGIGPTPVGSKCSGYWYTHGKATLEEALREAVWGEVCDVALPYGGVRSLAIIETGELAPVEGATAAINYEPAALILRQPKLRPAHYLPAIYYRPTTGNTIEHERAERARIPIALSRLRHGIGACGYSDEEMAGQALLSVAARYAKQVAAARTKRIVHGAMSCSNIALDAAYVDFGTITAVSDYGPIIVARGHPDATMEHSELCPTLYDLAYVLHKHSGGRGIDFDGLHILEYYEQIYQNRLAIETLKLSGIPEALLPTLPSRLRKKFCLALGTLAFRARMTEPFKLVEMPDKMRNGITANQAMRILSIAENAADGITKLHAVGIPEVLSIELAASYFLVKTYVLQRFPVAGRDAAEEYFMANCYRLNLPLTRLYRPQLVRALRIALNKRKEKFASLIEEYRRYAMLRCMDVSDGDIDVSELAGRPLVLNGRCTAQQLCGKALKHMLAEFEYSLCVHPSEEVQRPLTQ